MCEWLWGLVSPSEGKCVSGYGGWCPPVNHPEGPAQEHLGTSRVPLWTAQGGGLLSSLPAGPGAPLAGPLC